MGSTDNKKFGFFQLKVFFYIEVSLKEEEKSIYSLISLALTIGDWKIIPEELLDLLNLTKTQTLCVNELIEVVRVD